MSEYDDLLTVLAEVFAWQYAELLLEALGEVLGSIETYHHGKFDDLDVRTLTKNPAGLLQADTVDKSRYCLIGKCPYLII